MIRFRLVSARPDQRSCHPLACCGWRSCARGYYRSCHWRICWMILIKWKHRSWRQVSRCAFPVPHSQSPLEATNTEESTLAWPQLRLSGPLLASPHPLATCKVAHGDIKLANVLIFSDGRDSYTAKLPDLPFSTMEIHGCFRRRTRHVLQARGTRPSTMTYL